MRGIVKSSGAPELNPTIQVEAISDDALKIGDVIYTINSDVKAYVGDIDFSGSVNAGVFSPNGKYLVLFGNLSNNAKIFYVDGLVITPGPFLYVDNLKTGLNGTATCGVFTSDSKYFIIGGVFTGRAKIYSVEDGVFTHISNIYADNVGTVLSSTVNTISLSPDGSLLVLGGGFSGYAKIYSISGSTVTYISDLYSNSGSTPLSASVSSSDFSPDGSVLLLGGNFSGFGAVYTISGTTATYLRPIYSNGMNGTLSGTVRGIKFSPSGSIFVIGGLFSGAAKVYSISGTTITYRSNIYADAGTTNLSDSVSGIVFSNDGNRLILAGNFTDSAKVYSVSGYVITFLSNIYADGVSVPLDGAANYVCINPTGDLFLILGGTTHQAKLFSFVDYIPVPKYNLVQSERSKYLSASVRCAVFSPDGTKLVLGGVFAGRAKIFSISGSTATYVSDIYADGVGTVLSSTVMGAAFSPDGTKLVLTGIFAGRAKIYAVSGTTVTYVSDIYADAGTTALSSIGYCAVFSANGAVLVVGGAFTGRAKVYSVSGTTVTYSREIYADAGTTALSSSVNVVRISPDGTKLLLGGIFAGFGKLYSISGTTVTYLKDIYSDNSLTPLSSTVLDIVISSDGTKFIVGGVFSGYAKIYTISGSTITYVSDIYADGSNTALNNYVQAISFVGSNCILLGGQFDRFLKQYTISGSTVTFEKDHMMGDQAFEGIVYCISGNSSRVLVGGDFEKRAMLYDIISNVPVYYRRIKKLDTLYLPEIFEYLGFMAKSVSQGIVGKAIVYTKTKQI